MLVGDGLGVDEALVLDDLEAIEAQARFRGSQGRIRFAEAFVPVRVSWDLSTPEVLAPVVPLEPALRSIG